MDWPYTVPLLNALHMNVLTACRATERDVVLARVKVLVAYRALALHRLAGLLEALPEELGIGT
jgi:hypothetical protein